VYIFLLLSIDQHPVNLRVVYFKRIVTPEIYFYMSITQKWIPT